MRAIRVVLSILAVALALAACARQGGDPDAIQSTASADSCVGHCGDSSSNGSCYCDDGCKDYGDCCKDFADACTSAGPGAGGAAGGPDTQPTSGGAAGASSGGAGGSGGAVQAGPGCSAELCNTSSPGKAGTLDCYCDSSCIVYSDCCANKTAVCGS